MKNPRTELLKGNATATKAQIAVYAAKNLKCHHRSFGSKDFLEIAQPSRQVRSVRRNIADRGLNSAIEIVIYKSWLSESSVMSFSRWCGNTFLRVSIIQRPTLHTKPMLQSDSPDGIPAAVQSDLSWSEWLVRLGIECSTLPIWKEQQTKFTAISSRMMIKRVVSGDS